MTATTSVSDAHPLSGSPFAIELNAVSKHFGSLMALSDLTLNVPRGQFLALLGPNGAGKTTAISLMFGQRPPSSGTVRLLGGDPHRARVGAMLQESELPGLLTVSELIGLFAQLFPRPLSTARVLELADLSAQARQRGTSLSGGQRRRLVFARSIVGDPEVLFLDEPTTAMDPQSRATFWAAIHDMKARGTTIVLTTHYLEEAERVADQVVVIDHGRFVAAGAPLELRSQVTTARVRFLSELVRAERLLSHLFAAGISLRELEVQRASLEDAFLDLTYHPTPQRSDGSH